MQDVRVHEDNALTGKGMLLYIGTTVTTRLSRCRNAVLLGMQRVAAPAALSGG